MDAISDDFDNEYEDKFEEYQDEEQNQSFVTELECISQNSSLNSLCLFQNSYNKSLIDRVREFKNELKTCCQLNWLEKFDATIHYPKIELNIRLHGAIREKTLKSIAVAKDFLFYDSQTNLYMSKNYDQIIQDLYQDDYCMLQRIFQEFINDQRQRFVVYTEVIFMPDIFNFDFKDSNVTIFDVVEVIIDCIRFFTSSDITKVSTNQQKLATATNPRRSSDHLSILNPITSSFKLVPVLKQNQWIEMTLPFHCKLILGIVKVHLKERAGA
ncbi:unnamed protein product [Didymodactylos carnosus]|uniref:Uncharacterized protein n=1 Tax=Didymodactylos carnosus TaxID=1234261 RepID=A0A813S230_9BILA|nr:unnamed protein product [Didymodactylos carnosus]CAF3573177.1 unnamed protein product [Didymodactylos carnosus]